MYPAVGHTCGMAKVGLASDEDHQVLDAIRTAIGACGHEVVEFGVDLAWPEAGSSVADAIAAGTLEWGVVCCWTGTGVSIAANRVPGVRAALCADAETARGARKWNDANVLALSLRLTSAAVAGEIVSAFAETGVDPTEVPNIAKLDPPARG